MVGKFDTKTKTWLLTNSGNYVKYLDTTSAIYDAYPRTLYNIKPSFNLRENVIITSGTGTKEDPFEIALQ